MLTDFDFGLGETIDMLRRSVRDFCERKIVPIAERVDQSNEFPRPLWPLLGELGVLGITAEEKYGGAGLGYLAHCVVMRKLAEHLGRWVFRTARIRIYASINCVDLGQTSKSRSSCRISFPEPRWGHSR